LGGRVHYTQKFFGGILNRQDNESDVQQMKEFDIPQIDLVIVDVPFEKQLLLETKVIIEKLILAEFL
jgi:phosphoribosylaminoimidazolecarboxamide formyltransferase/IMP cyclohydrolase